MLERPTQSELQSAIRKLEQLGEYQTYFGNNPDAVVDAQVPHYQEYNYLHNLVDNTQILVNHYSDVDWLESHQVTDQTFQDALEAMQHAYRGCSLIFGTNSTTKPATSTPVIINTSNTKTNATQAPVTSSKTPNSSANTTAKSNVTTKAETFTPTAPTQTTQSTSIAPTQVQDNTTNQSIIVADNTVAEEVAVPATGNVEVSPRQVSWPALIAVVVTGAVVASIAIALIIRHEPRRTSAARSRYHR